MKVLLLEALANPSLCGDLEPAEWDVLIPQARSCGLLASLGLMLEQEGVLVNIPQQMRRHLQSEIYTHNKQRQGLEYEIKWLRRAMEEVGAPLILLKGAAYIQAGLPAGAGRLIADIDILVPRAQLDLVEQALIQYGWEGDDLDAYDSHYYRTWMHEIPPLAHAERESTVDVHHTLLPPTTNARLDASKLFASLREIAPNVYALSPEDMVLHSAAHLFHEGEFLNGLRDLLDIHRLVLQFEQTEEEFWRRLLARAEELYLQDSLYYALRYCSEHLDTPVPVEVTTALLPAAPTFPKLMDFFFRRGLFPPHPSSTLPFTGLAEFVVYVRSHYLRMPLYLLLPHLMRKAWKAQVAHLFIRQEMEEEEEEKEGRLA